MDNANVKYKPLPEENEEDEDEVLFALSKLSEFRKVKSTVSRKCRNCCCKFPWLGLIILFMLINLLVLLQAFIFNSSYSWNSLQSDATQSSDSLNEPASKFEPLSRLLSYIESKFGINPNNKKDDELSDRIPLRVQLDDEQTFQQVEKESNLAAIYWHRWKTFPDQINQAKASVRHCPAVQLTQPYKVKQNNLHWQQFDATSDKAGEETITMYLYNAYYDKRIAGRPLVRLITMNKQYLMAEKRKWWCLLWFEKTKQPVLVNASDFFYIWPPFWNDANQYGYFHPQLITCPVPKEYAQDTPQAVSLQARGDCDAVQQEPSNVLRVIYREKREAQFAKSSIGVCVQALRFGSYDVSVRMVEWLEMVRLLGADKVYFYVYGANDNIWKVLKHYQTEGLVEWRQLSLPGDHVNVNSLYNVLASYLFKHFWPIESLELNDCLYANLYRHDYLAVMDVDELIMPQNVTNWHDLIRQIQSGLSENDRNLNAYYSSRHSHVCEMSEETDNTGGQPIPEYLYMMRHTKRADLLGPTQNNKCIHRTDLVAAVHNHFPMRCINTTGHFSCPGLTIQPNQSILLHYRRDRAQVSEERNKTPSQCSIEDRNMWRYFDQLNQAVRTQLENIFVV